MPESIDLKDKIIDIFDSHADKAKSHGYRMLADVVIEYTDERALLKAFNGRIPPERQGMVLALLAARACVFALRNGLNKNAVERFNSSLFKRLIDGERNINAASVRMEQPEITSAPEPNNQVRGTSPQRLSVAQSGNLGKTLRAIAAKRQSGASSSSLAGKSGDSDSGMDVFSTLLGLSMLNKREEKAYAWFDHHVYVAALKMLGVDVPENVLSAVREHTLGNKSVDLAGLMKDDLLPDMIDDTAAYLHRCNMYVKHQVPAMAGPMGRGGFTPLPGGGGFMRITIL